MNVLAFESHEEIHDKVSLHYHHQGLPSGLVLMRKCKNERPRSVRLNQKRNSGENRAEDSGTDDALPHIYRAT